MDANKKLFRGVSFEFGRIFMHFRFLQWIYFKEDTSFHFFPGESSDYLFLVIYPKIISIYPAKFPNDLF